MKNSTPLRTEGDRTFHVPPSGAMFSLVASLVFALIVLLFVLVMSAR